MYPVSCQFILSSWSLENINIKSRIITVQPLLKLLSITDQTPFPFMELTLLKFSEDSKNCHLIDTGNSITDVFLLKSLTKTFTGHDCTLWLQLTGQFPNCNHNNLSTKLQHFFSRRSRSDEGMRHWLPQWKWIMSWFFTYATLSVSSLQRERAWIDTGPPS